MRAFGSGAALDVAHHMLAELLEAVASNERVARARKPDALIRLSLVLIMLSLIGAIPVALLG